MYRLAVMCGDMEMKGDTAKMCGCFMCTKIYELSSVWTVLAD